MESKVIPDSRISASSEWDRNHGAINARLNFKRTGSRRSAWSAKVNDGNQWLKVDFGRQVAVTHIKIQGREDCCNQWVTSYSVSYSQDNKSWKTFLQSGRVKVKLSDHGGGNKALRDWQFVQVSRGKGPKATMEKPLQHTQEVVFHVFPLLHRCSEGTETKRLS